MKISNEIIEHAIESTVDLCDLDVVIEIADTITDACDNEANHDILVAMAISLAQIINNVPHRSPATAELMVATVARLTLMRMKWEEEECQCQKN